jgi:hypothetical protein
MQDQLFKNKINQIAGYICDRSAEAISAAKELGLKLQ